MSEFKLIVGLGNPGKEYEWTRHNIGFLVVQNLVKQYKLKFKSVSGINGLVAEGQLEDQKVLLLLPLTFMNHSGVAVKQTVLYKKIPLSNSLIVGDDFSLDFGELRLRSQGSDGGHNGLKSVIAQLGTKEFTRLRIGIGHPHQKEEAVDYVLGVFNKGEKENLPEIIQNATECCVCWLSEGLNKAMSQFNKRKENG